MTNQCHPSLPRAIRATRSSSSAWARFGGAALKSVEKCRIMSKIAFTQRASPDTLRLGLVFRRLRKNDKLKHVATARPLLLRGAERGVSIRRGHPILCRPTKLCQESIPAHRHPGPLTLGQDSQDASLSEGLQWAVTPKLTMIAGRQLSIGDASGAKLPSRFNSNTGKSASHRRVAVYGCK